VPVGLMWGSDVARLKADQQTQQEWINTSRGQQLHLGRKNLVLNGPIDNPLGSCTSCHGFAQVARVNNPSPGIPNSPPALNASAASLDRYFKNIAAGAALSPDYVSVDYSLQLQLGIARALNDPSSGVSLPANLNVIGHGRGLARPVATKVEEVLRDQP
jgi:hypothetical protein